MLSVNEYAKEKGISRQAVLNQIKQGKLNAIRQGKKWFVVVKSDNQNYNYGLWVDAGRIRLDTAKLSKATTRTTAKLSKRLSKRKKSDCYTIYIGGV